MAGEFKIITEVGFVPVPDGFGLWLAALVMVGGVMKAALSAGMEVAAADEAGVFSHHPAGDLNFVATESTARHVRLPLIWGGEECQPARAVQGGGERLGPAELIGVCPRARVGRRREGEGAKLFFSPPAGPR